ncbi:MAG: adenylyltransferase/cytidyltransferase family protein [Friedmanniella sp.]|nr:adenylyltransferase/cytidyltransferase family protein [Friedmanniella sp.]
MVGYFVDSFDLINVGDLDLIAQARARCGRLVVGVLTDADVERLVGRPPVIPLSERMTLVSHVRGVDEVVVHQGPLSSGPDLLVFTAGDRAADLPGEPGSTVVLQPARRTASAVLRDALQPLPRQAVA